MVLLPQGVDIRNERATVADETLVLVNRADEAWNPRRVLHEAQNLHRLLYGGNGRGVIWLNEVSDTSVIEEEDGVATISVLSVEYSHGSLDGLGHRKSLLTMDVL